MDARRAGKLEQSVQVAPDGPGRGGDHPGDRQHNRRMVLVWLALVLAVTGMVATAAWTIGRNLNGLF
ncbi:hypothetical protein MAHJHV60_45470 [Mycobacterium avium subsp. hominissuis]